MYAYPFKAILSFLCDGTTQNLNSSPQQSGQRPVAHLLLTTPRAHLGHFARLPSGWSVHCGMPSAPPLHCCESDCSVCATPSASSSLLIPILLNVINDISGHTCWPRSIPQHPAHRSARPWSGQQVHVRMRQYLPRLLLPVPVPVYRLLADAV